MFNKKDQRRNTFQLYGGQAKRGYDWWWHSFTAIDKETKEEKPFYIEFTKKTANESGLAGKVVNIAKKYQ